MTPGQGATQLTRAALFALAAVGLAAAAHLAGGEPISLTAAIVAVPAVAAPMNLLARRRRDLRVLLPALGGAQVVLHELFMATMPQGGCHAVTGSVVGPGAMPGMSSVPAMQTMPGMGAALSMHCAPMAHQGWSAAMILTHSIATVVTALVLGRGEAAVWTLAQWLTFRSFPAAPRLHLAGRAPIPVRPASPLATTTTRSGFQRRGPPRPLVAV